MRPSIFGPVAAALAAVVPCCFSVAQAPAKAEQKYTIRRVEFKNPGPFSQQQLEDAAGLHAGAVITAAGISDVAQRLADSGYFDDVQAQLDAGTVIFALKPADLASMLPVGFENFVWLTPQAILQAIHQKLPLFDDRLIEGSAQTETISTALTDALAAKGVHAKIEYEVVEPSLRFPQRIYEFRVVEPQVVVANVKLAGVTPELVPLVQKSVNATAHHRYSEGPAGDTTAGTILAPLLDAGYINAALSNIAIDYAGATTSAAPVVVSATLVAGEVYHVSALSFAGAPLLSAEDFAAKAKLHAGDIASRKALLETLLPLDAAYRAQGYMDITIQTNPKLDAATSQVAYHVTFDPGQQYHVNKVNADGLDAAAQAAFDEHFPVKQGALYSPAAVSDFLTNNTALSVLAGYAANYKAVAFPVTHTVDLYLYFAKAHRGSGTVVTPHQPQ